MVARKTTTYPENWLHVLNLVFGIFIASSMANAFVEDNLHTPVFNPRARNVSFTIGETATLSCSIRGLETRFVYWMKMSEPAPITVGEYVFSPDDRFSVQRVPELYEWNLKIKDVREEDAGVYVCEVSASSERQKYRRMVMLRIKASRNPSPKMETLEIAIVKEITVIKPEISINGTKFVTKGSPIKIQCNATGSNHAPDILDWFKDGNKIGRRYNSNMKISDYNDIEKKTLISNLHIRQSTMTDAGTYMCRSTSLDIAKLTVYVLDDEVSIMRRRQNTAPETLGTASSHNTCSLNKCNEICILLLLTFLVRVNVST